MNFSNDYPINELIDVKGGAVILQRIEKILFFMVG